MIKDELPQHEPEIKQPTVALAKVGQIIHITVIQHGGMRKAVSMPPCWYSSVFLSQKDNGYEQSRSTFGTGKSFFGKGDIMLDPRLPDYFGIIFGPLAVRTRHIHQKKEANMNPQDRDYFGFEFTGGPAFSTGHSACLHSTKMVGATEKATDQSEQLEEDIQTCSEENGTT